MKKKILLNDICVKVLKKLADLITASRLGAIFVGMGIWASDNREANMDRLFRLMKTLNRSGSFVLFPFLDDFNSAGAIHLLLRETGSPRALAFRGKGERNIRGPLLERLEQVDAIMVLGADLAWSLPREDRKRLSAMPLIQVDSFETYTTQLSDVVFPTAMAGVEAEEVAYRMDGIPLRLSRLLDSPYPSDREIVKDLLESI